MANQVSVQVTLDAKQAERAIKALEGQTRQFESQAKQSFNNATKAFDVFKGVLGAQAVVGAIRGLAAGIKSLGITAVNEAKNFEQIQTQFKVLTGNAQEAEKVIRDLQNFTATTPFQFESVAAAGQQLLAFKFQAQELQPILRTLGDIAAGSGSQLTDLSLIFGQVAGAGKLTGERFLQLQERGINLTDALANQLGVSATKVREEISKGAVSFDVFRKALESTTAQGGLFFQATIQQSTTLGGLLSTLSDNFSILGADIGKGFLEPLKSASTEIINFIQANREAIASLATEAIKGFLAAVTSLISAFQSTVSAIQSANEFLTENKSLVIGATTAVASFTLAVNANRIAQAASVAVGKVVNAGIAAYTLITQGATAATRLFKVALASIGIGILVAGIAELVSRFETLDGFLKTAQAGLFALGEGILRGSTSFVTFGENIFNFAITPLRALLFAAEKAVGIFDSDLAASIASSRENLETLGGGFDAARAKLNELAEASANRGVAALEEANKIEEAAIKEATAVEESEQRKRDAKTQTAETTGTSGDGQTGSEDTSEEDAKRAEELAKLAQFNEQKKLLNQEFRLAEKEAELEDKLARDEFDAESRLALEEIQLQQNALELERAKAQTDLLGKEEQRKLKLIQATNKKELTDEKLKTDAKLKFDQQRAANFKSTLGTIQSLSSSGNKTLFNIGKAAAISQATIDGFQAVQKALSSAPPPINVALAATVGVATAANIAKIASTQPPSFQFGGIVGGTPSNTDNTLANVASGEMILNRRQQAELFAQANGAGGNGAGTSITVNVESSTGTIPDENIDNIIDNINNRLEFGNAALFGA